MKSSMYSIILTSTLSQIVSIQHRDKTGEGFSDWPFLSVHYWGEPANGTWTLDAYRSSSVGLTTNSATAGIIKKWKLLLYGTKENPLKKLAAEEDEDQGRVQRNHLSFQFGFEFQSSI